MPELLRRALDLLHDIDAGRVKLSWDGESPQEYWCGDFAYKADTGHIITVFLDCGGWDYIDNIVFPGGEVLDFDEMNEWVSNDDRIFKYPDLANYSPKDLTQWGL